MHAAHARRIERRKSKLTPRIISRTKWTRSNCLYDCSCEPFDVKRLIILVLLGSTAPIAQADQVEITSPDHAYPFAYGAVFSHQVEREPFTNQLIANVTFSNYRYTGDRQPHCDETFDFRFPGLRFDAARQIFLRGRGAMNGFRWRNGAPIFPMAGMSSRPAREFSCSKVVVMSRQFLVPVVDTRGPGSKMTTTYLCRTCLQAVSPFSAARGVLLPGRRLTARPFRS